jgi:hypothetical protein
MPKSRNDPPHLWGLKFSTGPMKVENSDLNGPRHQEFADSRRQAGVHERTFLQQTPMGDLVIIGHTIAARRASATLERRTICSSGGRSPTSPLFGFSLRTLSHWLFARRPRVRRPDTHDQPCRTRLPEVIPVLERGTRKRFGRWCRAHGHL